MTRFRNSLYALGSLVVCFVSLFSVLCFNVDRQGRRDQAQLADSIVVLGARVLPDGRPSEDLFVRTAHAIDLYRQGIAEHLICTGGFANDPRSAASVARSMAIAYGVPADSIFLADGTATTQEDAEKTAQVMKNHGWDTAILVSHPLHLYRCRLLFEQEGIRVYTSPTNTDLRVIRPQWRVAYAVREALFILWASVEQLGLPRSLGYAIQDRLYGWSDRLKTAWDGEMGTS